MARAMLMRAMHVTALDLRHVASRRAVTRSLAAAFHKRLSREMLDPGGSYIEQLGKNISVLPSAFGGDVKRMIGIRKLLERRSLAQAFADLFEQREFGERIARALQEQH